MHYILKIVLLFFIMETFLNSDDLADKYKQMMHADKATESVTTNEPDDFKNKKLDKKYNLIDAVKKIQILKQGTFESTSSFNARVNTAISSFQNEVRFFSKNGSREYSAGSVAMKSYDADTELMELQLYWNSSLKAIFSEIKNLETAMIKISNNDAKELFEKQKRHYFHIDIAYINSKLIISKIVLKDKYTLNVRKKKVKTKSIDDRMLQSTNKTSKVSSKYIDNENTTLDSFLHKFYAVGEENSANKVLPYYAARVDRYFSMKNVTRKDILKDKKRYYKKWIKRKYRLLNYEILNTSKTDRAILYTLRSTVYWEVKSVTGKVKHGTSTNTIHLYHDHNGIVVTSIR